MGNVSTNSDSLQTSYVVLFHHDSELNCNVAFAARDREAKWCKFPAMAQKCAAASPVFKELIQTRSLKTSSPQLIKLKDINAEALEVLLRFIHGFAINIDHSRLLDVRQSAQLYAINILRDNIDMHLIENVSASKLCSILILFNGDVDKIQLCLEMLQYIRVEKHKKILSSKSFLGLRMIPELSSLIQSPHLQVEESIIRKKCREWGQWNRLSFTEKSIDRHVSTWLAVRSNKILKSNDFYISCLPNHMMTIEENEYRNAQSEHQMQALEDADSDSSNEFDDTLFDYYEQKETCKGVMNRYFGSCFDSFALAA